MEMIIQCGRINISSPGGSFSALSFTWMQPGSILESKGMRRIFQKKDKKRAKNVKKRAKYLKIRAKMSKI